MTFEERRRIRAAVDAERRRMLRLRADGTVKPRLTRTHARSLAEWAVEAAAGDGELALALALRARERGVQLA